MVMAGVMLASFNVKSMPSTVVKAILNKVGTIFGAGVAVVPHVGMSIRSLYCHSKDGIDLIKKQLPEKEFRRPTSEEDDFLRRNANLQNDTKLCIAKDGPLDDGFAGMNFNDAIALPERLPGFAKTLSQAIEDCDYEHEAHFIAVAQHEEGHKKEKHSFKSAVLVGIVPAISTTAIAKACKAIVPYNSQASWGVHAMRFLGKTLGGCFLFYAYQKAFYMYAKHNEYRADQYVQPEYRPSLMYVIENGEAVHEIMKQEGHVEKLAAWREWILDSHPTPEQRCKALGLVRIETAQEQNPS
jgi:hypothetical protein